MGKAEEIVEVVIEELAGRRGFKAVLFGLDPDTGRELTDTLTAKVDAVLGDGKPVEPTTREVVRQQLMRIVKAETGQPSASERIEAAKVLLGRL